MGKYGVNLCEYSDKNGFSMASILKKTFLLIFPGAKEKEFGQWPFLPIHLKTDEYYKQSGEPAPNENDVMDVDGGGEEEEEDEDDDEEEEDDDDDMPPLE